MPVVEVKFQKNEDIEILLQRIRGDLEAMGGEVKGFALVLWDKKMLSLADYGHFGTEALLPKVMIPDFVKNRLYAEIVADFVQGDGDTSGGSIDA